MMIFNNIGAYVPLQHSDPYTFPVDDEQKTKPERKDYIELARFLYGDNWQLTKKILTFALDCGSLYNLHLLASNAPELLGIGTDLAFAYKIDVSGKNTMDQLDDSIRTFVAEFRHPDFVNTVWSDHPYEATDIERSTTNPPRVIKLMRVLYDDAQWEYTKLALEWGFDRTNYTRAKVTRLHEEGCKVAEEYRHLLTSKNITEEEVNRTLRNYLDESCFDINEADVEATLDIVQAWDYYMSRNGDKISKFLDDIRDVDMD